MFASTSVPYENSTPSSVADMAQHYDIYGVGDAINKYYVPVLVPIGFIGNILSFIVSKVVIKYFDCKLENDYILDGSFYNINAI